MKKAILRILILSCLVFACGMLTCNAESDGYGRTFDPVDIEDGIVGAWIWDRDSDSYHSRPPILIYYYADGTFTMCFWPGDTFSEQLPQFDPSTGTRESSWAIDWNDFWYNIDMVSYADGKPTARFTFDFEEDAVYELNDHIVIDMYSAAGDPCQLIAISDEAYREFVQYKGVDWEDFDYDLPSPDNLIPFYYDGRKTALDTRWFSYDNPSTDSNVSLATFSGVLSWAIYNDDGKEPIKEVFETIGIPDEDMYESGTGDGRDESYHYAIAKKEIVVDGMEKNLLIIAARGTVTNQERMGDHFTKAQSYFYGETAYDNTYEFEEKIMDGLNTFLYNHPELESSPMTVLFTGHSLGGAAVNLLAARFTMFADEGSWWAPLLEKEDVYAYTFGAIDSIDTDGTISTGYENIHNITNFYDSFGPNGWPKDISAAGRSRYGKFGHIDLFYLDLDRGAYFSCTNHDIYNYLDAVISGKVSFESSDNQRIASFHCPIDIEVYKDGKLIGRVTDNKVDYSNNKIPICISGDQKYIAIDENATYSFIIRATADGDMRFYVSDVETGNDVKKYNNVTLYSNKQMSAYIDGENGSEEVTLFTLDKNGRAEYDILEDGSEIPHVHNWKNTYRTDTPATCSSEGSESIHCSRCGAIKDGSSRPIARTAHKYSGWKIIKKATELEKGQQSHVCSVCGNKELREISQLKPTLKAITIAKAKATKKSAIIKWKKISKKNLRKIKKVQIQYSTDKNFRNAVKTKYAKAKKISYKIKGLKVGKKYYVRIRAYTKVGNQVHVSKWSKRKSFRVK